MKWAHASRSEPGALLLPTLLPPTFRHSLRFHRPTHLPAPQDRVVQPNPERHAEYRRHYAAYKASQPGTPGLVG